MQLSTSHYYIAESNYDGCVLEISINGGSFADILSAGGSFASGGYNGTISTKYGNPLAGRAAWTGNSGGFISIAVNLPAATAGGNIQLRWRLGSDSSVSSTGWYVDTVSISQIGYTCCSTPPTSILTFGPPEWLPDIGVRLSLTGNVTGSVTIRWTEEVTNALSNWPTLTRFNDFTGATQYIDSEATNLRRRFYRAVTP